MIELDAAIDGHAWRVEGLRRLGRADEAEGILEGIPESDPDALAIRGCLAMDRETRIGRAGSWPMIGAARVLQLRGQLALMHEDGPAAVRSGSASAYASKHDDRATLMGLATAPRLVGKGADSEPLMVMVRRFDELTRLVGRITAANAATDGDLHRRLGSICEAIGRPAEALAWYRLAIGCSPLDAESQKAIFASRRGRGREARVSPITALGPHFAFASTPIRSRGHSSRRPGR